MINGGFASGGPKTVQQMLRSSIIIEDMRMKIVAKLPPMHPGEMLREEFLKPMDLTPYKVAKACGVPRTRIVDFQKILQDAGLVATIRKTRGDDIDAACGQLAGQVQDRTKRRLATRIVPVATH